MTTTTTVIPQFVLDLAERLRTQDNRCTAHPVFVVQKKRIVSGFDPDIVSGEDIMFVEDGEMVPKSHWEKLEEAFQNDVEKLTLDDTEYNVQKLDRYGFKEEWENDQCFLTQEGADNYIKSNGHNLRRYGGEPQVYVDSFYRNAEMIQLREWLLSLGKQVAQPATV